MISRRSFIAGSAAVGAAGIVTQFGTQISFAAPGDGSAGEDIIIQVFLQGGCDGLSLTPPYGYPSYRKLRPKLAIDPPGGKHGALPLDSSNRSARFPTGIDGVVGLHPAMKSLYDVAWTAGKLAVIPICGMPPEENTSRSHFAATDMFLRGSGSPDVGGTWLARMSNMQTPAGPIPAAATTRTPALRGANGAVTITRLNDFGVKGVFPDPVKAAKTLRSLYGGSDTISAEGRVLLTAQDALDGVTHELRSGYPDTVFGRRMSELATLLNAGVGIRSASTTYTGWDDHADHGVVGTGDFHLRVERLAEALTAFYNDTNGLKGMVVIVNTEFGRSIEENGNLGTDHGRAGSHLVLGGAVRGGVYGDDMIDDVSPDPVHGDLPVLTDYRKIIAEVVSKRAGVSALDVVFPTYNGDGSLGLVA